MGRLGEELAADLMHRCGATVEARNVVLGGGELDLIVRFGSVRVAVEVKAVTTDSFRWGPDPLEHFDDKKSTQVWRLARMAECHRVDIVGVMLGPDGVLLRWVPNAS